MTNGVGFQEGTRPGKTPPPGRAPLPPPGGPRALPSAPLMIPRQLALSAYRRARGALLPPSLGRLPSAQREINRSIDPEMTFSAGESPFDWRARTELSPTHADAAMPKKTRPPRLKLMHSTKFTVVAAMHPCNFVQFHPEVLIPRPTAIVAYIPSS